MRTFYTPLPLFHAFQASTSGDQQCKYIDRCSFIPLLPPDLPGGPPLPRPPPFAAPSSTPRPIPFPGLPAAPSSLPLPLPRPTPGGFLSAKFTRIASIRNTAILTIKLLHEPNHTFKGNKCTKLGMTSSPTVKHTTFHVLHSV